MEATALHHRMRDMPAMANRSVRALSRLFVLTEISELVSRSCNPCRHVKCFPEKARERFLTPEEFRRVGAALRKFEAEGSTQASAIAALRLLMLSGCRMGEILSLRWDDGDQTPGVLRLRDGKTAPRMVPLSEAVTQLLMRTLNGPSLSLRGTLARRRGDVEAASISPCAIASAP